MNLFFSHVNFGKVTFFPLEFFVGQIYWQIAHNNLLFFFNHVQLSKYFFIHNVDFFYASGLFE